MKIGSILENQTSERRVAITPEIATKYISLGVEVLLCENYASHLGIKDIEYKDLGVSILQDEKQILSDVDIVVQLALLDDGKSSLLKENQTLIGVLNPYENKDKINDLVKRRINIFSLLSNFLRKFTNSFKLSALKKTLELPPILNQFFFFKSYSKLTFSLKSFNKSFSCSIFIISTEVTVSSN